MSQSQTLPRKFGELLRLGNPNGGAADRSRGVPEPPATSGVDGSFGLGKIVGVGAKGATGWTISVAQDVSSGGGGSKGKGDGRVVLYGEFFHPSGPFFLEARSEKADGGI